MNEAENSTQASTAHEALTEELCQCSLNNSDGQKICVCMAREDSHCLGRQVQTGSLKVSLLLCLRSCNLMSCTGADTKYSFS